MAKAGMETDIVSDKLRDLVTKAGNLDDISTGVNNLAAPLSEAWGGADAAVAVDYINALSTKMASMSEEIMKIHGWAETTMNNYIDEANKGANAYE